MKLGVTLAIGESFTDLQKKGQAARMVDYNIKNYAKNFEQVYVFTYSNEKWQLPKNCCLVPNKYQIPRILYSFLMPFINFNQFKDCDAFRAFQITGGIPASIARLFFSKKFLVNYGYDYQKVAELEGKLIRSALLAPVTWLVANLASVIVLTNKVLKKNLPHSELGKVKIIPNGVDTHLFKPKVQKKEDAKKAGVKILFVGRLEPEKNLENLLLAVKNLKAASLTIVGSGSLKTKLKSQAEKYKINISFIDKVDYYSLPDFYQKSDIFILPSHSEGHSKVLLEALSSGLVCVASDIPANRQIIKDGENGYLTGTTARDIEKTLREAAKKTKRQQAITKAARQTAQENFEVGKLIEKEIKILHLLK